MPSSRTVIRLLPSFLSSPPPLSRVKNDSNSVVKLRWIKVELDIFCESVKTDENVWTLVYKTLRCSYFIRKDDRYRLNTNFGLTDFGN